MAIKPRWRLVDEFPEYTVFDDGTVMNRFDQIKKPSMNQQGIMMINFTVDGQQNVRSLARLVAQAFIDRTDVPDHFDTPIHLNGDRTDCRAENLAWRPRWFAVKYHQQFGDSDVHRKFFQNPILLLETDEIFASTWDASIKYGILNNAIILGVINKEQVFPHGFRFEEFTSDQIYV